MIKILVAILLALMIGVVCRLFEIPLPAPPTLLGVGLILAITIGYIAADRIITNRHVSVNGNSQAQRNDVRR